MPRGSSGAGHVVYISRVPWHPRNAVPLIFPGVVSPSRRNYTTPAEKKSRARQVPDGTLDFFRLGRCVNPLFTPADPGGLSSLLSACAWSPGLCPRENRPRGAKRSQNRTRRFCSFSAFFSPPSSFSPKVLYQVISCPCKGDVNALHPCKVRKNLINCNYGETVKSTEQMFGIVSKKDTKFSNYILTTKRLCDIIMSILALSTRKLHSCFCSFRALT